MPDAPPVPRRGARAIETGLAAAAYVALTIALTWPIAPGLTHDVPADLGDSLLNMWIMAWVSDGLVAMSHGTMSFADLWNGNIFHPTPLTLTLSEHLFPQAIQGLPFYLSTGNIVLAYNATFLATFALSGLGMFLFVREVTGNARAAFVAGLFYAFLPYRLGQFPHIQTISSQWMPFALFGLRRYFDSGRFLALAGGTAAFVVQGLSSGYYLFYFAPVLLFYAIWELAARGRLADRRAWVALALMGIVATLITLPFLLPYLEAKRILGTTRPYTEIVAFSANLLAYLNTPPQVYAWGSLLNQHPQPEGDLWPGLVPIVAGLAAVGLWWQRAARITADLPAAMTPRQRAAARWLVRIAVAGFLLAMLIAATGGVDTSVLRATSPARPFKLAALAALALLIVSPRPRMAVRRLRDLTPFLLVAVVLCVWMSLGPEPRAGQRALGDAGPYYAFWALVPGYDGLRVPARFGMVAACLLAALSGPALARLSQWRRYGPAALATVGVLFLAEGLAVPMPTNLSWRSSENYADPWPRLYRLNEGPLAYRHLLAMPPETIVLELPLGEAAWDLRYMYYAGLHGKRIVNGYSGYYPPGYGALVASLAKFRGEPEEAWAAVLGTGATHLLLHEDAYLRDERYYVQTWAEAHGAKLAVEFTDGARLYMLPRADTRPSS